MEYRKMGCNSNVMNTELLANAISDNAKQMNQLPIEEQCGILSFHTISIDWPSFSQKNKYDVYVDNKNCSSFIWCRTDKVRTDNAKSQVIYSFNFGSFQNVFFLFPEVPITPRVFFPDGFSHEHLCTFLHAENKSKITKSTSNNKSLPVAQWLCFRQTKYLRENKQQVKLI